jgi:hypothetical protein
MIMSKEEDVKGKKKECLYGLKKRQVYLELGKAWTDYYNLSKEHVHDKKRIRHYEYLIHKLQDKLGMAPTAFRQLEVFGLYFYKHNHELFKEDVTDTLVEKGMIKTIAILESRMRLDKRPNMVQELRSRDSALLKYRGSQ